MNADRGRSPLTKELAQDLQRFLDHETDIPVSQPTKALPVSRAGIGEQWVSLRVPSFVEPAETITITGEAEAYAALPSSQRGVHMSRIVEALAATSERTWGAAAEYVTAATAEVAERQRLDEASLTVAGRTTVKRLTPVTRRASPDSFAITLFGRYTHGRIESRATIGATIMTACPCTQAYTRYSLIEELAGDIGYEAANSIGFTTPTFTHSQRGRVSLEFQLTEDVDLTHGYQALEDAAHLTFELLKRPDEHALVRRSHERPQFTEDVVRDVTAAFVRATRHTRNDESSMHVSCRNIESIHSHDAISELSISVRDARALLDA